MAATGAGLFPEPPEVPLAMTPLEWAVVLLAVLIVLALVAALLDTELVLELAMEALD